MFGFFRRKPRPSAFIKFCEEADDALILAYERRDVSAVVPYCDKSLLHSILEDIQSGDDLSQEYGIAKYRIRTFDNVQELGGGLFKVCKHIRHKDVSIRGMINIPVGDNIDETWDVSFQEGTYKIQDIRRQYGY